MEKVKEYLIGSLTGATVEELHTIRSQSGIILHDEFMEKVSTLDISEDFPLIEYDLYDKCYRAFYNISFYPEKRAKHYLNEFNEELKQDLNQLGDNTGKYKEKYIIKFVDYMNAKSRCMSSFITGPANFPVAKAEKAINSERNKYEDFRKWREKYFKSVNRVRTLSPEEDLYRAEEKLHLFEESNAEIKEINKIISKFNRKKNPTIEDSEIIKADLVEIGYHKTAELLTPHEWKGKLYMPNIGTYGTKIRLQKERIRVLKTRIERKENFENIEFTSGYIKIEDDRVKIFHDQKPPAEIIKKIKSRGFKWSRYWKCWCRKHTGQALEDAKSIIK